MAQPVEHAKRRRIILQKAMAVFYAEGYANTTFQKIADRCGVSRPILYLYFRNKRSIFRSGILLLLQEIETQLAPLTTDSSLTAGEKLLQVSNLLVDRFMRERGLFGVLLEYFALLRARGAYPRAKVLHMTAGARQVYTTLIRDGIARGDLTPCDPRQVYRAIFSLLEAATLRLAVLGEENVDDIKTAIGLVIRAIEKPSAPAAAAAGAAAN